MRYNIGQEGAGWGGFLFLLWQAQLQSQKGEVADIPKPSKKCCPCKVSWRCSRYLLVVQVSTFCSWTSGNFVNVFPLINYLAPQTAQNKGSSRSFCLGAKRHAVEGGLGLQVPKRCMFSNPPLLTALATGN